MFLKKSILNCAYLLSKLHRKLQSELSAVHSSNVILIHYDIDCQIDVQLIELKRHRMNDLAQNLHNTQ